MHCNILLLTIDALRADHVGCLGYHRDTTPFLDRLAQEGTVFTQAMANGPTTPFSLPAMATSTYPFVLQGFGLPAEGLRTTAEVLQSAGYATGGWSPNPYFSRAYNYHRGFQVFMDPENWSRQTEKARLRIVKAVRRWPRVRQLLRWLNNSITGGVFSFTQQDARAILAQAGNWIQSQDRSHPFFVWCHFNDVHYPWFPREQYARAIQAVHMSPRQAKALVNRLSNNPNNVWQAVTPNEMTRILDLYDTAIRYTDETIRDFVTAHINLEETIVIVTADHGEEFGDHDGFHRNKPYDETLRVPLIFAGGAIPQGRTIVEQVSLIDLAPTIADLCGLDPVETFQGDSLVPAMEGQTLDRVCLSYYNPTLVVDGKTNPGGEVFVLRHNGWKLISRPEGDELYLLERDPQERRNLIETEKEMADFLRVQLQEQIAKLRQDRLESAAVDLSEHQAIEERLRALGYIG